MKILEATMNERAAFYRQVVCEQIKAIHSSILVCGGGELDKTILADAGFTDVTISNLDERMKGAEYAPFKWQYENAEQLSFDVEAFDYVIIHAAIHHAFSPHKVLTEMYRVARKGVLAFESRDSFLMRILEKFKMTQVYEHAAVYYNDCAYGGVGNTNIPNYVYRWTEREIKKTINSYAPYAEHRIYFKYGNAFPCTPELEKRGKYKYLALKAAQPFYWLFAKLFPKQQNLFAFYIEKPDLMRTLFPWLKHNGGKIVFNSNWGDQNYNPKNSGNRD